MQDLSVGSEKMGYYETDYSWMWEIAGFLAATGVAVTLVSWMLRKTLGVERKKWFSPSSNFVNDFHQKVNDYFRWGSVGVYVLMLAAFGFQKGALYFIVATILIGGIQELFNAVMEKKHADNPNDYKFTLLHYPISIVIAITCAVAIFPETVEIFLEELRG